MPYTRMAIPLRYIATGEGYVRIHSNTPQWLTNYTELVYWIYHEL